MASYIQRNIVVILSLYKCLHLLLFNIKKHYDNFFRNNTWYKIPNLSSPFIVFKIDIKPLPRGRHCSWSGPKPSVWT